MMNCIVGYIVGYIIEYVSDYIKIERKGNEMQKIGMKKTYHWASHINKKEARAQCHGQFSSL